MQFLPARSQSPTAPLGQRPTQQPIRRGFKAMAGAEGERPASPAQEGKKGEAASPQQAKPAAPEAKKESFPRIPSIPVTTRDGLGEEQRRRRRRCCLPQVPTVPAPTDQLSLCPG